MTTNSDSPPHHSGGFVSYICKFAVEALNRAASASLSHSERREHINSAHQAVRTSILLRKVLHPMTAADAGEVAVFDKASREAAKLLRLGHSVMFVELDDSLRSVACLRDVMVAVIESTDPDSPEADRMLDEAARVANLAMEVSTRMTRKTADHIPEMPCRTEAELGISALLIASSLSAAVEEAWRISRTRAAARETN